MPKAAALLLVLAPVILGQVILGPTPLHAEGGTPFSPLNARPATPPTPQTVALPVSSAEAPPSLPKGACPVLPGEAAANPGLEHVRASLQPNRRLDILAVGSGTVLGPEGKHPDDSFSYRMAQQLKAASPQTTIILTVRGGRGLTAEDMLKLIDQALSDHPYQLLLWQTGTVEAVRGLPADAFSRTLAEGAGRAAAAGADLVLIDPQYSRFLRANTDLDPYEAALARAGALPGATLFRRFDLMRTWANQGGIDLERVERAQRETTANTLHACLGRALADLVLGHAL